MRTHSFSRKPWIRIAVLLVAVCSLATTTWAQAPDWIARFSPLQLDLLAAARIEMSRVDLDAEHMSKADWKVFVKAQTACLQSGDRQLKQQALQQIIFNATLYGDRADFCKSASCLYDIYRFDRDEQFRIMALAGLHAIGFEETMRQLARDVRWETSPRLRRLTMGALADHYAGTTR
jgi:hypothetical protein